MKMVRYACILFLALAAGCIQVEETLTLNADGSGTMELKYGMPNEKVDQFAQAIEEARQLEEEAEGEGSAGMEAESPLDFDEASIRESFKEFEPFGVTLRSVDTEIRDGWKYIDMKIDFENLQGLTRTSFMSERQVSLKREGEGRYTFRQTSGSGDSAPPEASTPEMEDFVRQLMQGFKVIINVKTPGRVVETSAPLKKERTATWEFDLEKDPQAVSRVGNLDMWVTFEDDGLEMETFQPAGPAKAR